MKNGSVLLLFLASTLVLPLGFSGVQAEDQSDDTNQTNSTTNMGQQISDFVHQANTLFQQQRAENIQAIKECHNKMQTATSENKTQIIDECKATMKTIREKYQDERKHFQELFKQFREKIITLRHDAKLINSTTLDKERIMKNIGKNATRHDLDGITQALEHKKMIGNGTVGIERALKHINKTSDEIENDSTMHPHPKLSSQGPPGEQDQHGKR